MPWLVAVVAVVATVAAVATEDLVAEAIWEVAASAEAVVVSEVVALGAVRLGAASHRQDLPGEA
jgi:hypothetical protein